MKPNFYAVLFTLITGISISAKAQMTTYYITSNVSTSVYGSGAICSDCIIVVSPGVTVTINNNASCNNCTFTGGTISIVAGSNFTLNGVDSFKNETVLIGHSFNSNTLTFYGDTVAVNTAMSLTTGRTDFDSSRVSINAAVTLNKGDFYKDSLHLNANLTIQNAPADFIGSNVTAATGTTISTQGSVFTNSVFALNGTAAMNITNNFASTGSSFYLSGSSKIKSDHISIGTGTLSTLGTSSVTSNNEINISSSTIAMGGSSTFVPAATSVIQNSTLNMAGTAAMKFNNNIDFKTVTANLADNSNITANIVTLENHSSLVVGDGTSTSAAFLYSKNAMVVADNSQLGISSGNNYFRSNVSSWTGGTTGFSTSGNTISCNHGATTGYSNSCTTNYVFGCATMNNAGALGCTTLAVADLNLSATATGTGRITLTWSDADNATADHYLVQRKTATNEWTTLSTITASGYASGEYQYNDATAPAGTDNYRIERTDKNGQILYSKISTVTIETPSGSISIFPNPVTGHTFYIKTPSTEEMVVNIFTLTGQLLFHTSLKGSTLYPIHLPAQIAANSAIVAQVIGNTHTQTFTLLNQ